MPDQQTTAALNSRDHLADCPCQVCEPYSEWFDEPTPLADHGKPFGLLRSLWAVLRGVRLYG